jgi:hypothetical protein
MTAGLTRRSDTAATTTTSSSTTTTTTASQSPLSPLHPSISVSSSGNDGKAERSSTTSASSNSNSNGSSSSSSHRSDGGMHAQPPSSALSSSSRRTTIHYLIGLRFVASTITSSTTGVTSRVLIPAGPPVVISGHRKASLATCMSIRLFFFIVPVHGHILM